MTSPVLLAGAGFLTLALPTLAGVLTLAKRSSGTTRRLAAVERLQRDSVATTSVAGLRSSGSSSMAASAAIRGGSISRRLGQLPPGRRLLARAERDLQFTPWSLTPLAYLLTRMLAALLLGAAVWFMVRIPLGFLGGVLVAHLLAGSVVAHQVWLYRRNVGRQTEDVIDILIAHLRAGQSLVQSLGALAEEAPVPARQEYGRVSRQVALGTPVSEALRSLERRVPITSVSLLISALNMHHRIGGDLPMLLRIAANTVHDQIRLQDELTTAAAGQMLAAYVVVALPIVMFGLLYLIDRPYMSALLQPGWNLLLGTAVALEVVGFLIIRSFTRIEL